MIMDVFYSAVTLCLWPRERPGIVLKKSSSVSDLSVEEPEQDMSSSAEAAWQFVGL